MVDQSEKLQKLLHGALLNHLKQVGFIIFFYRFLDNLIFCLAPGINLCSHPPDMQVKIDSEDAVSAAL